MPSIPISQMTPAGALTGAETVPVVRVGPPNLKTTTQAIANLAPFNRPLVDWYDGTNTTPSAGTIDTTVAPYNSAAVAGESTCIGFPATPADAGIWILGSVAIPAAVPITRRADSVAGSLFVQNETIAFNPANAVANGATFANTQSFDAGGINNQETCIIGTDTAFFNGNTALGPGAVVAGNVNSAPVTGGSATIAGGVLNVASGNQSTISGGTQNIASKQNATIGGGNLNTANGDNSTISGGLNAITRGVTGAEVYASGVFAIQGDAQRGKYILRGITIGVAPAIQLDSDGSGVPAATNQITLPNNSSYAIALGSIVAREVATGNTAVFAFIGAIKRGANAAATAIVAGPVVVVPVAVDAGAIAWAAAVTADVGIGCLNVTVTGEALKTIQWVCTVETVENVG